MTRTDVGASSRPQTTVGAASIGKGSRRALRRLSVLPVALLLAAALVAPTAALAEETGATGYAQKPPEPTVTTTTTTPAGTTPTSTSPTPASGTSPSKEASTPAKAVSPSTATSSPTTTSASGKTLPFTGFDLSWTVGIGLLLLGVGFSIVAVQRRQRRDSRS